MDTLTLNLSYLPSPSACASSATTGQGNRGSCFDKILTGADLHMAVLVPGSPDYIVAHVLPASQSGQIDPVLIYLIVHLLY